MLRELDLGSAKGSRDSPCNTYVTSQPREILLDELKHPQSALKSPRTLSLWCSVAEIDYR